MRTYTVLDPSTREELKDRIKAATDEDNILPITALERLDQLTSRRRTSEAEDLRLRLTTIHLGDEGHIICQDLESGDYGRLDYVTDEITLTLVSYGESNLA